MSWKYFTKAEMVCRCGCGRADMDDAFMAELDALREAAGFPFIITSGFRCPEHNRRVSKTKSMTGPHTTGLAVDISVWGARASLLVRLAYASNIIQGVGVAQRGQHRKRFIHLDALNNSAEHPRPWIWSY